MPLLPRLKRSCPWRKTQLSPLSAPAAYRRNGCAPNVGADVDKALLYLHGGGYCYCGPGTHRLLAYNLSRATGMKCLLLDNCLAPEHPYPAAVEDAVAAYA